MAESENRLDQSKLNLALVPVLKTAPALKNAAPPPRGYNYKATWQRREQVFMWVPTLWVKHLRFSFIFFKGILLYGLILALYSLLFYVIACATCLLSNPRLFVRAFFGAMPVYLGFVVEQTVDELKNQVALQLR